ncbi:MAG: glycosyltransferase family 9 protein [Pseudomonadota bacterium]
MRIIDFFGYKIFKPRKFDSLPQKILIIRTAHIGDVLFTTPMLVNLRRAYPQAQIDYLCGDWAVDIIKNNPHLDNIIVYNAFWLDRRKRNIFDLKNLLELRRRKYDLIIQCGFEYKDNILARIIGAKYIIGYHICGFGFLLDKYPSYPNDKIHDKDLHLDLLKTIGIRPEIKNLQVYTSKTEEQKALRLLEQFDLSDFIAVGPGVGEKVRQWPVSSWAQLLPLLLTKFRKVAILGSSLEVPVVTEIMNKYANHERHQIGDLINFAGQTSLMESAAIIKQAKAFIGMESSLAHIANALRKKSIAIFSGFTDTKRWAINDSCTTTLKSECNDAPNCVPYKCPHRQCLTDVKPEFVFSALLEKLEGNNINVKK